MIAVWTFDLLSDCMGGEFDVFMAKEAGHFQVFGRAQGDGFLAARAGDFLVEALPRKFDVGAASRAGHLYRLTAF